MDEARSELSALYLGLKADVEQCRQSLSERQTGFWDRVYVRTFFSLVEGVSFRTRQYIIAGVESGLFTLDSPRISFLSECTYTLDSKGNIKEREAFLQFLPGFKLTYKSFGKCLGMEDFVSQAFGHHGFHQFQEGVNIRNRLTHPKRAQEMIVNGLEIESVREAEEWFHSLALPLIERAFNKERES